MAVRRNRSAWTFSAELWNFLMEQVLRRNERGRKKNGRVISLQFGVVCEGERERGRVGVEEVEKKNIDLIMR